MLNLKNLKFFYKITKKYLEERKNRANFALQNGKTKDAAKRVNRQFKLVIKSQGA